MQRYNYSHRGAEVSFLAPAEEEIEADGDGFIDIDVRWTDGMMSNTSGLVVFANGCSGALGFIGVGNDCRPCPEGGFCTASCPRSVVPALCGARVVQCLRSVVPAFYGARVM